MKSIPVAQQYRRATGEFINRQDNAFINKTQLDNVINTLAAQPGRHRANAARQDMANATLTLISLLSSIRPVPLHNPTSSQNATAGAAASIANYPGSSESQLLPMRPEVRQRLQQSPSTHNRFRREANSPSTRNQTNTTTATSAPSPSIINAPSATSSKVIPTEKLLDIRHQVQNQLLDNFLQENQLKKNETLSPIQRVNLLTTYLKDGEQENIDKISRILLSASAMYGGKEGETLSTGMRKAAIVEYLNQAVFAMSLDEWLFLQAKQIKTQDNFLFSHGNLQNRLTRQLNIVKNKESYSAQTRLFYQNEVLKKMLPTLMLNLSKAEKTELEKMNVDEPRWGFIYAGAMLLSSSGADFTTLPLQELEEVGMYLDVMLRKGAVPQEYIEFFKIPAMFNYVANRDISERESVRDPEKMQQIFKHYFDHTAAWVKEHNPLIKLPEMVNNWKTRRELALEELRKKGVSESWVIDYLDSHDITHLPMSGHSSRAALPNIDECFSDQNRKIAAVAGKADIILLPHVFDALSDDEQTFIQSAKVERVRASFDAAESIRHIPMHRSSRLGIDKSGALVHHVPDSVDLLRCTKGDNERIYSLTTHSDGEYELRRVDRKRESYLHFLEKPGVPSRDPDYKLKLTSFTVLKKEGDPASTFIKELAKVHSNKLFTGLEAKGYDKTTQEKVGDFILSLVPFYTCVTESIKGNIEEAIPACLVDIIGVLPLSGLITRTGVRFGTALSRSTAGAVGYGIRQTSLNSVFRETGKKLVNQFPSIAVEISPTVMQNLGVNTLRCIDPGVEILSRMGMKGIKALESIIKAAKKSRGINILSTSLEQIKLPAATTKTYNLEKLYDPQSKRMMEVVNIGAENGSPVLVQMNRETGEFFDQKYNLDADGNLQAASSPVTEQLALAQKKITDTDVKPVNPPEAQASGSRAEAGPSGVSGLNEHGKFVSEYNHLPPLQDTSEYWNTVRKVTDDMFPLLPDVSNTKIQKLTAFIPELPLYVIPMETINKGLLQFVEDSLSPYNWRAFSGFDDNVPPHIAWIQKNLKNGLQQTQDYLARADAMMQGIDYQKLMDHQVGKFISGLISTNQPRVVEEAARRLSTIISRSHDLIKAAKEVDYSNIVTISTDLVKMPDMPESYMSLMTDQERQRLSYGATNISDPEARILIFADAFLAPKDIADGDSFAVNSKTKMTIVDTICHELTHSSSCTLDIFRSFISYRRQKLSGEHLRNSFLARFAHKAPGSDIPSIFEYEDFNYFMEYLKAYQGIEGVPSNNAISRAVFKDKMLMANIMFTDADVVARTITSLVENHPFNAKFVSKREAPLTTTQSVSSNTTTETDYVMNLLPLLLAQAVSGIMTPNNTRVEFKSENKPSTTFKQSEISGIPHNVQIYGNNNVEQLLEPENNEVLGKNAQYNVKNYKKAIQSLVPKEKNALKTWTRKNVQHKLDYSDSTPGMIGGIQIPINKKLLKGIPLQQKEKTTYRNMIQAMTSKKLPRIQGNFIRESGYTNYTYNPWLEDAIEVNDYVTNAPAFMSVTTNTYNALSEIIDANYIENRLDSLIFYKVENATKPVPLLPLVPAKSPLKDQYVYPPNTLFKVNSLAFATPSKNEAFYANNAIHRPKRVAVVLTEVDDDEAKKITSAKNLFTGKKTALNGK